MAFEHRDNSGSLFRLSDEERKSENFPQYEGELKICCPGCGESFVGWIKAWVKEGKKGKFFSLAWKPKQARRDNSDNRTGNYDL